MNIKYGAVRNEKNDDIINSPTNKTVIAANLGNKIMYGEVTGFGQYPLLNRYADDWQGEAVFGLTDTDYWNKIRADQAGTYIPLKDSVGKGNANSKLSCMPYFGTAEDVQWAGTDYTGLENSGLITTFGDGAVLAHIRGLSAGNYLLLVYGQQTWFDLTMLSGSCPVKTSAAPAFYTYNNNIFKLPSTESTAADYTQTVFPIRTFTLSGVRNLLGTIEWMVVQLVCRTFLILCGKLSKPTTQLIR